MIAGHDLDSLDYKSPIDGPRSLESLQRPDRCGLAKPQPIRLKRRNQQGQRVCQRLIVIDFFPVNFQLLGPARGQPSGGRPKEAKVNGRAGDPCVCERVTVSSQVGTSGETLKYRYHLFVYGRIVGIRAEIAKVFMQTHDSAGGLEHTPLELREQSLLKHGTVRPTAKFGRFQFTQE